jgi:hypothetical protein
VEIDTDYLKLGTRSYAYITLKNTGNETIKTVKVEIIAGRDFDWPVGYQTMTETFEYSVGIKYSESETLQQRFDLPTKMSGVSLIGTYDVTIKVWVNGQLLPVETIKDLPLST